MLRSLGISFGVVLFGVGLFGTIVALVGVFDPTGTKLADDGDPFGVPPTLSESILVLAVYASVCAVGIFLLWRAFRKQSA